MNDSDVLAIGQVQARYGYLMDDLDWDAIGEVFTEDCVFDASAFGLEPAIGYAGVRAMHEGADHPLAHHATNVLVQEIDGDVAVVRSKALGTYAKGRAFSGEYRDTMARTPGGWRIRRRTIVLRQPLPPADGSAGG